MEKEKVTEQEVLEEATGGAISNKLEWAIAVVPSAEQS